MKTNHDGTVTLKAYDTWTSCVACGQRVTGDSIHTCSPQLKQLTDEEIMGISGGENLSEQVFFWNKNAVLNFARALLRKASEK